MDILNCIVGCNSCFWSLPSIIGGLVTGLLTLLLGAIGAIGGTTITIGGTAIAIPTTCAIGTGITIPTGTITAIGGLVTGFLAPFFTASFCSFPKSLSHNITEIVLIILGPVEVNAAYVDGSIKAFLEAAWKLIDNLIP